LAVDTSKAPGGREARLGGADVRSEHGLAALREPGATLAPNPPAGGKRSLCRRRMTCPMGAAS